MLISPRRLALPCLLTAIGLLWSSTSVSGQQGEVEDSDSWDVTLARGETVDVDFTTDEGTWM